MPIQVPKARLARIAVFAAASAPDTSAAGSASAVSEALRLLECVVVTRTVLVHLREDEVSSCR